MTEMIAQIGLNEKQIRLLIASLEHIEDNCGPFSNPDYIANHFSIKEQLKKRLPAFDNSDNILESLIRENSLLRARLKDLSDQLDRSSDL